MYQIKTIEETDMKQIILSMAFCLSVLQVCAQLTLDDCRKLAQENYPLVHRYGLIEQARGYDLANAGKGYLPQLTLAGRATYQSDITELPVKMPGVDVKRAPKDQYDVAVELQQTLWDGGEIRNRKRMVRAASDVEHAQHQVDMYALNERVDQLFFGILLLDEQLKQNDLLQEDLGRTYRQVSDYMANGIAAQSDLDAVSVERLNTGQRRIELETLRCAYAGMLSAFIGKEMPQDLALRKPEAEEGTGERTWLNNRPELLLFEAQGRQLGVREAALNARLMPRFGLFVQGGYGNPGLNMLKDEFNAYYLAGVRMSWNLGTLYTLKTDRRRIDTDRRQVETGRDVFLFNTRLQAIRQNAAVKSMRRQMADDDEIIRLRGNIRRAAEAKVQHGAMTVTDMLREITAENLARQAKALHEVQWLMNIWQVKQTLNQ